MVYVAPDKLEREELAAQGLKRCGAARGSGCQQIKPHSDFHNEVGRWDGFKSRCKECLKKQANLNPRVRTYSDEQRLRRNETMRKWRAANPDRNRLTARKYGLRKRWGTDAEDIVLAIKASKPHHAFTGDDISYKGVHQRISKARGRASEHLCIDCSRQAAEWSYRGDSPKQKTEQVINKWGIYLLAYSPNPLDYDPRCAPCHRKYDQQKGPQ